MKNYLWNLLLMLIVSLICINVSAQEELKRVEIEAKVNSDNYQVVPVGKLGVVIFSEGKEKVKSNDIKSQKWIVTLYDVNFKETWSREVLIAKGLVLKEYREIDGSLYISFTEAGVKKKSAIQLVKIGLEEGFVNILTGEVPPSIIDKFSVNKEGNAFFGGHTSKTKGQALSRLMVSYCTCFIPVAFGYLKPRPEPLLYYADFHKGTIKGIHPKEDVCVGIADINTIKNGGTTEVLVLVKSDKKKKKMLGLNSKIYDENGKFVREYKVKSKTSNILSSGYVSSNSKNKFIIGTYKKELDKDSKKKYKIIGKGGDNGVYFTKFDNKGKQKMIKFYDFTKFNGFEDYVSSRVKKKVKKQKKKILIGYNLIVHEPVYENDEMIVVSEAYYKEYHTETRCCDGNGKSYTVSVFDGYRTTHGLISSFNLDGELLWSNTFVVNTLSWTLKETIRMLPTEEGTVLAFNYNGAIYSKIIKGEEVLDVSITEVETSFNSDKVKSNYESDMNYWYENYYIAYGYQTIKKDKKKSSTGGNNKRKIFYFNKIVVE